MKKILLVLILIVGAFWLYRSVTHKEEPAPAPVTKALPQQTPPKETPVAGSSLNHAFPKSAGDYKVVFTQEKDGFAQAELVKGSAKVAALSISDTNANPSAREKYRAATKKIAGHPFAANGSQGSGILVADRYQVQVRSLQPAFTAADRESWLEKFNLDALKK